MTFRLIGKYFGDSVFLREENWKAASRPPGARRGRWGIEATAWVTGVGRWVDARVERVVRVLERMPIWGVDGRPRAVRRERRARRYCHFQESKGSENGGLPNVR